MSETMIRWTSTPGATAPDGFLKRFDRCGDTIQLEYSAPRVSSQAYTAAVLQMALRRPAELMIVGGSDRDLARAAAFRCASPARVGTLGLYEAVGGPAGDAATETIVNAALEWAEEQGLDELFAPVDANTWFNYRFVLPGRDGSTGPSAHAWEPEHPAAYLERFRRLGFEVAETFETVGFDFPRSGAYTMSDLVEHTRRGFEQSRRAGFRIERLEEGADTADFLDELHPVCMEAFRDGPIFEPLPLELFRGQYQTVLDGTHGHITFYARNPEGRLAGFVFAFPDRNALVVKTIAVDPNARGQRLSSALLHPVFQVAAENGITKVISALIREGNTSMFLVEPHKVPTVGTWVRRYALLRREVGP